jgi:hypothetical protein
LPVHGGMRAGWESARGRVLARAGIGVLTWVVDPGLVDEAVGDGLAWEMRLRALPSRLGVYFVLGLCLFSGEPYGQVLRQLTAGLQTALGAVGWRVPASTALTGVRRRVGEKPLESLFRRLCSALSPGRSPWSHHGGLLVVAWDGTAMDACDSPANVAAFGKPGIGARRGQRAGPVAACPQIRLVTLVACGTRALLDAAIGPWRGKGTGERALARQLTGSLRTGMLLLADRGFYSYGLWRAAAGTGAQLLWRAKNSMHLPVVAALPDGSWLTHINDPATVARRCRRNGARRRRGSQLGPDTGPLPGITVRVIEFTLTTHADDGTTRTERYRLLTTLTDWRAHPAATLASLYGWRWAIETSYRECKTYLRGPGRTLRGHTPTLARQELWAYLVIYQALRTLICHAAAADGLDPDRISFTATLHAARRTITTARDDLPTALAATETEIRSCLIPPRPGRVYPRAVKKPTAPYPSRPSRTSPLSHQASYTITLTPPPTTTQPATHQPKHPTHQPNQPP